MAYAVACEQVARRHAGRAGGPVGSAGLRRWPSLRDAAATQKYIQANYALVQVGNLEARRREDGPAQLCGRQIEGRMPRGGRRIAAEPRLHAAQQRDHRRDGAQRLPTPTCRRAKASSARRRPSLEQPHAHERDPLIREQAQDADRAGAAERVRRRQSVGRQRLSGAARHTIRFDQQFMPNWVAIGELPRGCSPRSRAPVRGRSSRRTNALEDQLTEFEASDGVETWGDIMNALVLNP